ATVVTALSLWEDRATVRSLISYAVRFAPINTFRFVLPAGTGSAVRINGEGVRETTLHSSENGDEWTVVTQDSISGAFALTLEWALDAKPAKEAIRAPEIRAEGVTAQRGFLILEGSETLRLTTEAKNLAETDLSEVPTLPWKHENRVLAAYRYVAPPYLLEVKAEKFKAESPVEAIAREAALTTTVGRDGVRLTQAVYSVAPMSDRQFFEVRLPEGAQLWSVLVNGEGAKPARQKGAQGESELLVPLPAVTEKRGDFEVTVLFREEGAPLTQLSSLSFGGPTLKVPVNRTVWDLNLPPGFEYLSFGGSLTKGVTPRIALLTFIRTAYYPDRLVFQRLPLPVLIILGALVVVIYLGWGQIRLRRKKKLVEVEAKKKARPITIFRFFEWIVVLGVIAVLAAIATPNFLEAQSRSKVSRAKADMRSLATAVESYYVDNNAYPPDASLLWQGAVKYLSDELVDPFAAGGEYYGRPALKYEVGEKAFDKALRAGIVRPEQRSSSFWMTYSVGPDGRDDGGEIIYDPTNGTVSVGDVVRTNYGAPQTFDTSYSQVRSGEQRQYRATFEVTATPQPPTAGVSISGPLPPPQPSPAPAASPFIYDPTNGTVSEGDVWRVRQGGPAPATTTAALPPAQVPATERGIAGGVATLAPIAGFEARAREAGLLSLAVEIPEGGYQRRFEALKGEALMEVRLMTWEAFQRVRFIVWIAALLVLAGVWVFARRYYAGAIVAAVAVSLFVPVLMRGPWLWVFNTAFQGAILSLAAPLLSVLVRRTGRQAMAGFAPMMLIVAALAMSGEARCEVAGEQPVRILVPYTGDPSGFGKQDPLAFMSQEEFARLWNAAVEDPKGPFIHKGLLTGFSLEGELPPEDSAIRGALTVRGANPSDAPSTKALSLAGARLENSASEPAGAIIEAVDGNLLLRMEAHWAGVVRAPFVLPCDVRGATGKLHVEFPEDAFGSWRVKFPYPEISMVEAYGASWVKE
ncbi:MAG: hypothetical protein V2A74_04840, partial [bacterium]